MFAAFLRWMFSILKIDRKSTQALKALRKDTRCLQKVDSNTKNRKFVVLDMFPIPIWALINSLGAHQISEINGTWTVWFSLFPPNHYSRELYRAVGLRKRLRLNLLRAQFKAFKTYRHIVRNLKSKEEILNIEVNGVQVGIDIYESILRRGRATVSLDDPETYRQIHLGLTQYFAFEKYFKKNQIAFVQTSHDNYIGPGLLSRMGFAHNVPTILANQLEINILSQPFTLYNTFKRYREYFQAIPKNEREDGIAWAKGVIEKRRSGKVGVNMAYQQQSAFALENDIPRQTNVNKTFKVLVLTHDFFDNPHGYAKLPFADFWEWLMFLGDISTRTSSEWYIKTHKDFSKIEQTNIDKFLALFPNFKQIDSRTSFHQLADEGIGMALTCHGTAGHELPLVGIPVMNAAYNPHVAYSFNIHIKDVIEYEKSLLSLDTLKLKVNEMEIAEFFFVHYRLRHNPNFILCNPEEIIEMIPESAELISWLSNNFSAIADIAGEQFRSALETRRMFSCESVLPLAEQQKF
jgi:hypothetical protein